MAKPIKMAQWLTFATIFVLSVYSVSGNSCPAKYKKLSKDHSFCKPPNPSCHPIAKGTENKKAEIAEILDAHNTYRSKVASGNEPGLPTAGNMLQMTWDQELADIAQKWAEQCKFGHDCGECRSTPNMYVGQNIAFMQYSCQGGKCEKKKPDWKGIVKMFYDEVKDFNSKMVNSVNIFGGKMVGHFTQVTWAETWKVGCGYVLYQEGNDGKQYYVCNYGPGGNMMDAPLYKKGAPCSACPAQTCCGNSCKGGKSYPGLCRKK